MIIDKNISDNQAESALKPKENEQEKKGNSDNQVEKLEDEEEIYTEEKIDNLNKKIDDKPEIDVEQEIFKNPGIQYWLKMNIISANA